MIFAPQLFRPGLTKSGIISGRVRSAAIRDRLAVLEPLILQMFAGTAGAWYDGRSEYVRQDSGGTTAVAASGDMVGRLIDRSGNGHHCLQTDNAKRSAWAGDGSINFRGTNSIAPRFYEATGVDLTGCAAVTVVVAVRQVTTTGARIILGHGILGTSTGGFEVGFNATAAGKFYCGGGVTGSWVYNAGSAVSAGNNLAASVILDPAGGSQDGRIAIREYGVAADEAQTGSGIFTQAAFRNNTLCIGAQTAAATNGGAFDFYGVLLFGRKLTAEELAICEEWAALRCPNTATAATLTWADSGPLVALSGYNRTSSYANVSYTTSATAVQVSFRDETGGSTSTVYDIGVFCNGTHVKSLRGALAGDNREIILLPGSGEKTVRIVNSGQGWDTYPSNEASGQYVTAVAFNAAATLANTSPTNRLIIYGDSISVGANSSNPQTEAWAMLVRAARGTNSTAVEGWGFRQLYDDASDSTKRAAFVTRVQAYGPAKILMCIGSNDYGLTGWGHAAFGTAYAATLDDFHAAMPDATIICVSPLTRATEGANSYGSTMEQYRSAIASACSGRSWVTYVDGSTILTLSDLSADGLHPTTSGHAKIAAYIAALPGIL